MPVQRFRDFDAARRATWTTSGDADLVRRLRHQWRLFDRVAGPAGPRGVRRFASIAEANADRDAWVSARVQRLRIARGDRSVPLPP